jgi:Arm DNA-binding domain
VTRRVLNKLTIRDIATTVKPGRYSDGGNLYFSVRPGGRRNWVFRFTLGGKVSKMGLGSAATVTLAEARVKASEARRTLAAGLNPIAASS